MKIFITTLLLLTNTLFASTVNLASSTTINNESQRLCQVFNEKASQYKNNMRNDVYAKKTLKSYEKRAKLYCDK